MHLETIPWVIDRSAAERGGAARSLQWPRRPSGQTANDFALWRSAAPTRDGRHTTVTFGIAAVSTGHGTLNHELHQAASCCGCSAQVRQLEVSHK